MPRKYTIKNIGSFELPDKAQRVFIVGADTYLGSHLAKYFLQNGEQVVGCGKAKTLAPELAKVQYAVTSYDGQWSCMPSLEYDWVLLCHDPREGRNKHIGVLESLVAHLQHCDGKAHLCYPSTFSVCEATNGVITEKSKLAPKSELDLTIASAEIFLNSQNFIHDNKIITNILRLGDVYGDELGFSNMPGLVNSYLELASAGKDIPLYGLGLQKRSIVNIADVCRVIVEFLNMDFLPREINFPGENLRVVEIANQIANHYKVEGYLESPQNRNVYCNPYGGDQKLSAKLLQSRIPTAVPQKLEHWLEMQNISPKQQETYRLR